MPRPVEVQARPNYRLWLRFDDGADGEVDLGDMVGRGVFTAWDDVAFFESVRIAPHGALLWGEDIDLCPDAMYLRLTGKRPEDLFPTLNEAEVDA
ncbi:MAG: DUF2442 domain-containing protein [Planctomycetota bacterium]